MNPEASAMSKSMTESVSRGQQTIIEGSTSPLDKIFPILDQSLQQVTVPSIITSIVALILPIQGIIISLWLPNKLYNSTTYAETKIVLNVLSYFFQFMPLRPTLNEFLVSFIIGLVACFFVIFWFVFQLVYFKSNHRLMKWSLYVTQYTVEIILPVFLVPISSLVGVSFSFLLDGGGVLPWVYFIISVILLLVYIVLNIIIYSLKCSSTYLRATLTSSHITRPFIMILILNTVSNVLASILQFYPDWIPIALQIAHAAVSGYILFQIFFFPFLGLQPNAIIGAVMSTFIVDDIAVTVLSFINGVPVYITLVICAVSMIVFTSIYLFIFKRKIKKMKHELNSLEPATTLTEERINFYSSLGIDTHENLMLMYLHVGFENACQGFYDFTLIKFILSSYQSTRFLCYILRVLSFFPNESRQLSYVFSNLARRHDLSFEQRFLLYEVYRVKMKRQSSISSDATDRFTNLKTQSNELENFLRSFWVSGKQSVAFCEDYSAKTSKLKALWEEGIRDYPNNPKMTSEFSRFLTECAADFEQALVMHQRSTLIENGRNFATDYCFRSLVRAFPCYLKDNIVDFKGNIQSKAAQQKKGNDSSVSLQKSGSAGTDNSTLSSQISLDAEMEDAISKQIYTQGRLRLTLHNALEGRETCSMTYMLKFTFIVAIIVAGIFIMVYFLMESDFQSRRTSMSRLILISRIRLYGDLGQLATLVKAIRDSNRMDNLDILTDLRNVDNGTTTVYLDILANLREQIATFGATGRTYIGDLLTELADLSRDGVDIYTLASVMLNSEVDLVFCDNYVPMPVRSTNLKNSMIYLMFLRRVMTIDEYGTGWWQSQNMCELSMNYDQFMVKSSELFNNFYSDQNHRGEELQSRILIFLIALPIALLAVILIPQIIFISAFINEVNVALDALQSLNPDAKEGAMSPIMKNSNTEGLSTSDISEGVSVCAILVTSWVVIALVVTALAFVMIWIAYSTCAEITTQNRWMLYAALRLSTSASASYKIFQVIITNGSIGVDYMVRSVVSDEATEQLRQMEEANTNLLVGSDEAASCFGYDDQLDELNMRANCELDGPNNGMHDTYRCASTNQQLIVFKDMASEILQDPDRLEGSLNDEMSLNMMHITVAHVWGSLSQVMLRLEALCEEAYQSMMTSSMIFMIIGIIMALVIIWFCNVVRTKMFMSYSTVLVLIKHVPPAAIMQNKKLIDYILRKTTKANDSRMSISQSVIYNSTSGIMCTGLNGVVEIINPAVSNILGYTPEQLLGQPFQSFVEPESAETLLKQVELMKEGQAAATYEGHVQLIDDSEGVIDASVIVLGMTSDNNERISSFVIIFQDESELVQKQKEAVEAKAKSEELLYQILPKDIVLKLNQGEKDISFSVPSATIIFVDIVKFSDYAALLTPQEIMGNLSQVFASFDAALAKYPLITKIKLIGDVYMAASGLFAPPDANPSEHAMQMVQFAFDCLSSLEEVNVRLNANFQVRIGINSGGPLIAGVLGTDKPVFDIIGDPINIAARLQSTDLAGRVQISIGTKELVDNGSFDIMERGEVFLKGKGNQKTYFVSMITDFMSQFSSSDVRTTSDAN